MDKQSKKEKPLKKWTLENVHDLCKSMNDNCRECRLLAFCRSNFNPYMPEFWSEKVEWYKTP